MEKIKKFRLNRFKFEQILADKDIPSSAKLILFNLYFRLGGKNYSFPSQERIGRDLGLTGRQVRKMLRVLKDRKIICWKRGAFNVKTNSKINSNQYDLTKILIERKK